MNPPLPAGIGLSRVRVYSDESPDGQRGGTPHMHLACTELYVTLSGHGAAEFLSADGFRRVELTAGVAVQIPPGTLHRLVTGPDPLQILVVMENGDLNEQGDVVFPFPDEDLADAERYDRLAAARGTGAVTARRDRAVVGFTTLVETWRSDPAAGLRRLRAFYERAVELIGPRAAGWSRVVAEGPALAAAELDARTKAIHAMDLTHLMNGRPRRLPVPREQDLTPRTCGLLWSYRPRSEVA